MIPEKHSANMNRQGYYAWFLFFSFILILLSRNEQLLTDPRFWAEEGSIYFTHAYTHTLTEQLSFMAAGYYNLINVLGTALAHRLVPLEYAPLITTIIALLIQVLPAVYIIWASIPALDNPYLKLVALLLLLFVLPNQEVWLNTINSQFYLAVTTVLILLYNAKHMSGKIISSLILMIAGFTGLISLFIFPLFVLKAWLEKSKEKWFQASILLLAGLIQAYLILASENGLREGSFDWVAFVFIFLIKVISLPVLGADLTIPAASWLKALYTESSVLSYLISILTLITIMGAMFKLIKADISRDALYCIAAALILFFFSTYGALGDKVQLINAPGSERYFTAPNILFYTGLLMLIKPDLLSWNVRSVLASAILALVLLNGLSTFWIQSEQPAMKGPSWKQQILANADNLRRIDIWPSGWFVNLNHDDNQRLKHCRENTLIDDHYLCLIYADKNIKIKLLFISKEQDSLHYKILAYHILENRNPEKLPPVVMYDKVTNLNDQSRLSAELRIMQDGELFSAILKETRS